MERLLAITPPRTDKEELAADLDALRQAAALHEGAIQTLAKWPVDQKIVLDYTDEAGVRRPVEGGFVRFEPGRVEVRKDKLPLLIPIGEITAASMAAAFLERRPQKSPADSRGAALFCLFDGSPEAAGKFPETASLPEKYKSHSRKPLGDPGREAEARKVYSAAESRFASYPNRLEAVEKLQSLLKEFADSFFVRRNRTLLLGRCEAAKDFVFLPGHLTAGGSFRLMGDAKGENSWTSGAAESHLQMIFSALPSTEYRCWIYGGACCADAFPVFVQGSEMTGIPPGAKESVTLDPGGAAFVPLKHTLTPSIRGHATHPAGKPPARWGWVQIPLPKYASPGTKTIRLIAPKPGFSVAYGIVSARRESPPKDDELRDLAKARVVRPGTPEPGEWLLLGPFPNAGNSGYAAVYPPETLIDLSAPLVVPDGIRRWMTAPADVTPGNKMAAVNFGKIYSTDEPLGAYALIHVKAPQAMDAKILMGSSDSAKVWVNGQAVHGISKSRSNKPDEDKVGIKLNEGWNRLLFKILNDRGAWTLSARITDPSHRPVEGLLYDAYGNSLDR
jgi:hypothetical protein